MREPGPQRRARRVLRALLRLYPSGFRRALGADLVETAVHRWADAVRRRGAAGGLVFWLTEGSRFAVDGMLERLHSLPSARDEFVQAWRQLLRAPSHHGVAILSLALGVGATAATLTVADAVVFRPLPYDAADALYLVRSRFGAIQTSSNSMLNLRELQGSVRSMAWLAGAYDRSPAVTGGAGEPERASVLEVTAAYLPGMGARVTAGRLFGAHDFAAGAEPVAVVSESLWQRRWGGDGSLLGTTVLLDTVPYTVVGVMASSYRDPEPLESGAVTAAWIPVRDGDRAYFTHRDQYWFQLIGRVAEGASREEAQRELSIAGRRLAAAYPAANRYDGNDLDFVLHSLMERTVGDARERILLLAGAALLLLLLACANAANLFLARGVTRSAELAVRSALGASRSRLALQLFVESVVTAALAGIAGTVLGALTVRAFLATAPAGMPRLREVALDGRALLIVLAVTALAAVVFGTLPALRGARTAGAAAAGARTTATRSAQRLQSALVALEVALSFVLVASAALLLSSFTRMLRVHPGFEGDDAVVVDVRPPVHVDDAASQRDFYRALLERARAEPNIARAAVAYSVPGQAGGAWTRVATDADRAADAGSTRSRAAAIGGAPGSDFTRMNPVSADYFAALAIPLRAGRAFEGDPDDGDPLVVIIDEAAAQRFFPDDDVPLGRHLALGEPGSDAPLREVVGIVGNILQRGAALGSEPQIYLPYRQRDIDRLSLVLETAQGATLREDRIRRFVADIAPGLPVDGAESVAAGYAATADPTRFLAFLLSAFAGTGLLLAMAGTYATAAHALSRRLRELAIRAALGARAPDLWRLVLSRSLLVAAIGVVAGLGLTLVLVRLLTSQLFGVAPRDPITLTAAAALIAFCVVAAGVRPARRAARVDAVKVLRE